MLKTIFTKAERFLLRNNRMFILHSESSSDSSDDPESKKYRQVIRHLKANREQDTPYFAALLAGTKVNPEILLSLNQSSDDNMSYNP